jgi:hypothetical protein
MSGKSTDSRFMAIFAIVGLICFILANSAHSNIPDGCDSNLVRDGLTVLEIVSVILCTLGIAYIVCNFGLPFGGTGHDCYHAKGGSDITGEVFMIIAVFVSVAMAMLSLTIGLAIGKNKTCNGAKDKDKGRKLKFYAWAIFVLYVITSVLSGLGLYWTVSYVPAWARGDKGKKKQGKKKGSGRANVLEALFGGRDDDDDDEAVEE